MKKILAITGTRADYGIYRPIFDAIGESGQLSPGLIVVGMHLKKTFGHTVDTIRSDGYPIVAELDTLGAEDSPRAMAAYIGHTLSECARVLEREEPDMLLLLGDRGEQLAGAIAAAELGISIAHLHGGERSGTVDDAMRNAITQLASIHFASANIHAKNIMRMKGLEGKNSVFVVGAPALDTLVRFSPIPKDRLFAETNFDSSFPTLIFIQHPDTLDQLPVEEQLQPSLHALESFEGNILVLGANADAGGIRFNKKLRSFSSEGTHRHFVLSLPHMIFLSWAACADVLVGNSSSGIIEMATLKLPVVNIGNRQRGRLRSGNVIDVPYDAAAIGKGIHRAMGGSFRKKVCSCKNAHGDGHASERIVRILEQLEKS